MYEIWMRYAFIIFLPVRVITFIITKNKLALTFQTTFIPLLLFDSFREGIIGLVLQLRKLTHREVTWLSPGHTILSVEPELSWCRFIDFIKLLPEWFLWPNTSTWLDQILVFCAPKACGLFFFYQNTYHSALQLIGYLSPLLHCELSEGKNLASIIHPCVQSLKTVLSI